MTQTCIGISVGEQPELLRATLDSVRRNTVAPIQLILLPDGPNADTTAYLAKLHNFQQSGTAETRGAAACFNRLASCNDADVVVLLESGAQVAPGWLEHLLMALDSDFRNGLAGPSTNRSWNEQCVYQHAGGTGEQIAHAARDVARRFGNAVRTLEPLYSLADFCYAVRREVIEAVGAADESYKLGPCWEMDYNIRAARAGFQGVWACAAYVHRAPFTARRRRDESLYFEASKRRYQDKFCALRIRGEATDYEPHCKGDDCEHFAPRQMIQLHIPLPTVVAPCQTPAVFTADPPVPLVSCIMPTVGRPHFVLQSIRYFQQQDYPERELLILGDGPEGLAAQLPADPRVRYFNVPRGMSIGAKRNRACELARGSIIAQWDDDDWYAPGRLSLQIAPLRSGEADVSGLVAGIFFDLDRWQFWTCTAELHRRLFHGNVHGGTLVYQRRVWEQGARYPDRSLAEDAVFLREAVRRGARLRRLDNHGAFLYLRHGRNSWAFPCGQYLDPRGWQRVAEPEILLQDRAFYAAHSAANPASAASIGSCRISTPDLPLVSCIMPTANRRRFVPHAIRFFQCQDYAHRELIILDDGTDAVADLVPADERIRYVRLSERRTVGAKRNLACEQARGELIAHWDDDDWHAPHRLSYQVEALLGSGRDMCGLQTLFYYDVEHARAWRYVYPANQRVWLAGNTLLYRRDAWARNRFPDIQVGEDARFVWSAAPERLLVLPDPRFYAAIIHPGNVSPKRTHGSYWQSATIEEIRRLIGADWTLYARTDTEPPIIGAGRNENELCLVDTSPTPRR